MRTKTLNMIIAFIAITINLFSQNNIDPPKLPLHNPFVPDTIVDFNDASVFKKQFNDFIIGYNYGDTGKALDSLLGSTHYLHSLFNTEIFNWNLYGDNNNWYLRIVPMGYPEDCSVGGCQSVYYEPAITVNKNENFTPDPNSTGGSIFGFQNKNSNLTVNNNKVIIPETLNTTLPILSGIWPNDELRFSVVD